jgi:hypothetical protein
LQAAGHAWTAEILQSLWVTKYLSPQFRTIDYFCRNCTRLTILLEWIQNEEIHFWDLAICNLKYGAPGEQGKGQFLACTSLPKTTMHFLLGPFCFFQYSNFQPPTSYRELQLFWHKKGVNASYSAFSTASFCIHIVTFKGRVTCVSC